MLSQTEPQRLSDFKTPAMTRDAAMMNTRFQLPPCIVPTAVLVALVIVGCGPPQPIADGSNPSADKAAVAEPTDTDASEKPETGDAPTVPAAEAPAAETPADSAEPATEAENNGVSLRETSPEEFQQYLAKHRGQVVLVDFWATWCIPCREKFPETVALSRKYSDGGLVVISMSLDDPEAREAALKFLQSQNAPFDHLVSSLGGSDESFEEFEIEGGALPHLKLYDRKGELRHTFSNSDPLAERQFTHADVERRVQELLAEK